MSTNKYIHINACMNLLHIFSHRAFNQSNWKTDRRDLKSIYFSTGCCLSLLLKKSTANFSTSLLKRQKKPSQLGNPKSFEAHIVMFWRQVRNCHNQWKRGFKLGFLECKFATCISYCHSHLQPSQDLFEAETLLTFFSIFACLSPSQFNIIKSSNVRILL